MNFSLARLTALASLALSLHCPAMADELADANMLLANKEYPQALALYVKLADAGNVEAQFHLGEMHWYGEAGKIDVDQARLWFGKAAGAGNAGAKSALETMRQRELRRADIAYWVSGYDGAELKSGKFNCARPFVPPISKSDAEVKRVEDGYLAWKKCYNGFVQNINDALPPGKRIPAGVAKLMNQAEYDEAVAHLDQIYAALLRQASTGGAAINADYKDWHEATSELVEGIQGR